ncbi:hydrogenase nickel incorporation protein HypB [Eubacterium xylanophilum]|uniref:hydrogenase nickel incorporation protein HypB n=1 Tax=Eubacterium xylanophilum TaxID=39497 RepID=UPI00047E6DBB|nr:hydrogenase nickel incorporation protein HypB [Eubacterium xylanophilum]
MEVKVVKQIMEWNEDVSNDVINTLKEKKVCMINVMGSPGAGKTTLIKNIINRLKDKYKFAVIEGDIAGQIDAEDIESMGIPCVQLQTQGACHIEAMSVQHMLPMFDLDNVDVLIVENIGNLVCPAEFNIGEDFRIAALSVPEGDDKVVKYPLMFSTSDGIVMHKYDMMEFFDFDDKRVENDALDVNPKANIFRVSSKNGDGMDELIDWIQGKVDAKIR